MSKKILVLKHFVDGVKKYGFHGTSHHYVALEAAKLLGKPLPEVSLITCHLGNGSSIAAIERGKSIETSMGLTPLEGLIMGTRCGDIDPAAIFHIMRNADFKYTAELISAGTPVEQTQRA